MKPMAPPPEVLKKLQPVCEATGLEPEEIWGRQSKATHLAARPSKWREFWGRLTLRAKAALKGNWAFWGRPAQQIPAGLWFIWLILAGRGWGKSRTGAMFCIEMARQNPGKRGALVGATASDVRDIMILGESGIIASSPADFLPKYEPSKRLLTWPNGAQAISYTADKPDRLRGPNLTWAWCDELAAWRYPQAAWDMLMYCMRRGKSPRVCITTTPRPIDLLVNILEDSKDAAKKIVVTRGTTWDNFWHLSRQFFDQVVSRNKGALSRQEIFAEMLMAVEGALWGLPLLDRLRRDKHPELSRVVVSVDPCEELTMNSDECGIVALGRDYDSHGWVLRDVSFQATPAQWARRAYELYLELDADAIVCETNKGGKMVAHVIRSVIREGEPLPRIIEVKGRKGKLVRAEPVSAIYEEGRFHHVGTFARLEDEMRTYIPGTKLKSPNRMDALVYGALELFPAYRAA
jgi:phage terminase large subunit-like protein